MNWTPRPYDIAWTAQHLSRINHGGTWLIPANGSVWRVDHDKKNLACVVGPRDDMFDRVTICCKAIGYTTSYDSTGTSVKNEPQAGKTVIPPIQFI